MITCCNLSSQISKMDFIKAGPRSIKRDSFISFKASYESINSFGILNLTVLKILKSNGDTLGEYFGFGMILKRNLANSLVVTIWRPVAASRRWNLFILFVIINCVFHSIKSCTSYSSNCTN